MRPIAKQQEKRRDSTGVQVKKWQREALAIAREATMRREEEREAHAVLVAANNKLIKQSATMLYKRGFERAQEAAKEADKSPALLSYSTRLQMEHRIRVLRPLSNITNKLVKKEAEASRRVKVAVAEAFGVVFKRNTEPLSRSRSISTPPNLPSSESSSLPKKASPSSAVITPLPLSTSSLAMKPEFQAHWFSQLGKSQRLQIKLPRVLDLDDSSCSSIISGDIEKAMCDLPPPSPIAIPIAKSVIVGTLDSVVLPPPSPTTLPPLLAAAFGVGDRNRAAEVEVHESGFYFDDEEEEVEVEKKTKSGLSPTPP